MSLHDWLKNGWLTEHLTSSEEIKDLFDAVDRDLTDCQLPGLSPDWRLHIAYNAALLIAAAALAAAGYRPRPGNLTTIVLFNHLRIQLRLLQS